MEFNSLCFDCVQPFKSLKMRSEFQGSQGGANISASDKIHSFDSIALSISSDSGICSCEKKQQRNHIIRINDLLVAFPAKTHQ